MKRFCALVVTSLLLTSPAFAVDDLGAAINTGDFAGYLSRADAALSQKAPAEPGKITEVARALLRDPAFARTLDQRQLIYKTGADRLGAFAKASPANRSFLAWVLSDTRVMDLYLEGAVPIGIAARDQNNYALSVGSLEIWRRILDADPDSRQGLYLRLAIATALRPPGTADKGAGQSATPADPVARYKHFKTARQNRELFPSFDGLTVWEYEQVVSSNASDADLAWAREMIDTWRPDLRINELVVNSTSEVWRRASPHPYTNYASVLSGGGKCGPRSSWSVMVCQAFGIPAIGVGQPAHACVAYKAHDPSMQPQPGSAWKVGYGRGWQFSKLEGMSGPDFLAGVEERSNAAAFSRVEHLRWLAAALAPAQRGAAVMEVAKAIEHSAPSLKTDLTASLNASEADQELPPPAIAPQKPTLLPKGPFALSPGGTRIAAAAFSKMSGVAVYDCFTGGKQVNFQKSMKNSWLEYVIDVPAAGTYSIALFKAATPNDDQVLNVLSGTSSPATIQVPNTTGLWATTPAVKVQLAQGRQTLRIAAPLQRGVAVLWVELKPG